MSVAPEGKNPLLQIAEDLLNNVQGLGSDIIDAARAVRDDPSDSEAALNLQRKLLGAKDEVIVHLTGAGMDAFGQLMANPAINKFMTKALGGFVMKGFGLGGMQRKPKPEPEAPAKEERPRRLCDDPWFPDKGSKGRQSDYVLHNPDNHPVGEDEASHGRHSKPEDDQPSGSSPGDDIVNMLIDRGGRAFYGLKANPGEAARTLGNAIGDFLAK